MGVGKECSVDRRYKKARDKLRAQSKKFEKCKKVFIMKRIYKWTNRYFLNNACFFKVSSLHKNKIPDTLLMCGESLICRICLNRCIYLPFYQF